MSRRSSEADGLLILVALAGLAIYFVWQALVWLFTTPLGWLTLGVLVVGFVLYVMHLGREEAKNGNLPPVRGPSGITSRNTRAQVNAELPSDEFGPLFKSPQDASGYFYNLMQVDQNAAMYLRQLQIARESIEIALASKNPEVAESRMQLAVDMIYEVEREHSKHIPTDALEAAKKRVFDSRKEFATRKYINYATAHTEKAITLKTARGKEKRMAQAAEFITQGLSDPEADHSLLRAFHDSHIKPHLAST